MSNIKMKKQRPIPFSGEMPWQVSMGIKTHTRRIMKEQPEYKENSAVPGKYGTFFHGWNIDHPAFRQSDIHQYCPYGQIGSLLWMRESYYQVGHWELVPGVKTKTGRDKWKFVPDSEEILFEAPKTEFRKGRHHKDPATSIWHKRLGRFMPRKYGRIVLEITDIRIERLNDITEADAQLEGCNPGGWQPSYSDPDNADCHDSWPAADSFMQLWESINGEGSWESNPYVWVVVFRLFTGKAK